MKVKFFGSTNMGSLEQQINEFIADKELVRIKLQVTDGGSVFWYHALVMYIDASKPEIFPAEKTEENKPDINQTANSNTTYNLWSGW